MNVIGLGLIISASFLILFFILTGYEAKKGTRFMERFRTYIDLFVLRISHGVRRGLHYIGTDLFRQIFHYLFHRMLRFTLSCVTRGEKYVRTMMRVNKTLAKDAERESETRTKLEEIALHKIATALSEEEKQARKEKTLLGR